MRRIAVGEFGNVHSFELLADTRLPLARRQGSQPEADILGHSHVWKEGVVLEHDADFSTRCGNVPASFAVIENAAVQDNSTMIGRDNPGNHSQRHGFSSAGGAQQAKRSLAGTELHLQFELVEGLEEVDIERRGGRSLIQFDRQRSNRSWSQG